MLFLALLVIPVGFISFIWFFSFSVLFYLLSYQYVIAIAKFVFSKLSKIIKRKEDKIYESNSQKIVYNLKEKKIKLNTKTYDFEQLQSISLVVNNQEMSIKELKKVKEIKSLEIKIGTQIKKITYRHFKYITNKVDSTLIPQLKKEAIKDYKKLSSLIKKIEKRKSK